MWKRPISSFLLLMVSSSLVAPAVSFSKEIYGVPRSGWSSPDWNWGYAVGTGHDCARICRQRYSQRQDRIELVKQLKDGDKSLNFEEIKLVLGLAWQRGRWDGSDGGRGGYGEVLQTMAEAQRYEEGPDEECARRLVQDMQARFPLLRPTEEQSGMMMSLLESEDADVAQRRCSGLVLEAMGFIESGL